MNPLRHILVGVDLSQSPDLSVTSLPPDAKDAIRQGCALAARTKARLTFLSALSLPEDALRFLDEDARRRFPTTVEQAARNSLEELVRETHAEGIAAQAIVCQGTGWVEIIRYVQSEGVNLVIVGAQDLHGLRRLLMGSNSRRLIRKCPCPVWVARADRVVPPNRLLVATDFSPTADEALRVALALRGAFSAQIDVLHAVEYPLDRWWGTGMHDAATDTYHAAVRAQAEEALHQQLHRVHAAASDLHLHLVDKNALPDSAIMHFLGRHQIDLLVIGTRARGGLSGMFLGNTVERLMAEVSCSILAVKPPDFVVL